MCNSVSYVTYVFSPSLILLSLVCLVKRAHNFPNMNYSDVGDSLNLNKLRLNRNIFSIIHCKVSNKQVSGLTHMALWV